MGLETFILLLFSLLPLIISPGPANILYAASGSSFGVKKTIPFWLATNITSFFQTLAVGLGLNLIMQTHLYIVILVKYVGIGFLLYLAYKFFSISVNTKLEIKPLTFKDGVIIEILNAKYLLIPSIMFSQFHIPSEGYIDILMLAVLLLCITLITSMTWIIGGNTLAYLLSKEKIQKYEGKFFALLLILTAIWLGFN